MSELRSTTDPLTTFLFLTQVLAGNSDLVSGLSIRMRRDATPNPLSASRLCSRLRCRIKMRNPAGPTRYFTPIVGLAHAPWQQRRPRHLAIYLASCLCLMFARCTILSEISRSIFVFAWVFALYIRFITPFGHYPYLPKNDLRDASILGRPLQNTPNIQHLSICIVIKKKPKPAD